MLPRNFLRFFKNVRCPVNNNPYFKKFRETYKNDPEIMDSIENAEIGAHATTVALLSAAILFPPLAYYIDNKKIKALKHKESEQSELMTDKFDNEEVNNRFTKSI